MMSDYKIEMEPTAAPRSPRRVRLPDRPRPPSTPADATKFPAAGRPNNSPSEGRSYQWSPAGGRMPELQFPAPSMTSCSRPCLRAAAAAAAGRLDLAKRHWCADLLDLSEARIQRQPPGRKNDTSKLWIVDSTGGNGNLSQDRTA